LLVICIAVVPILAVAAPYGGPIQLNPNEIGDLMALDVAAAGNGDVIVLWQSGPVASMTRSLQRYDTAGRPLLAQALNITGAIRVAAGPSGTYAVLSQQANGSLFDLFVTVFNRGGGVIVPALRVNDSTTLTGRFSGATIAMNASGQFAVAWAVPGGNGTPHSVYARRFNANGAPAAPQVLVHANTRDLDWIGSFDVALDAVGNFVVAWDFGDTNAIDLIDVFARRFNASAQALGPELRVNTTTPGDQGGCRIAMNGAGSYVIVWHGPPAGGSSDALFGQRFSAAGSPLGSEFQITTSASSLDVAMAPDGSFVATWEDDMLTALGQIAVREYTSAGSPLAGPTQVSLATNDFPISPQIAMDPAGNYTIAWWQTHFDQIHPNRMLARRYSTAGVVIQPIGNGQTLSPLSGAAGSWQYFKLTVPPGQSTVDIIISGGTGDADLYTRWGALPTLTAWDGRPFLDGNNEGARMLNFPPGDWYIGINGFQNYASLALQVSSH
jgi:hypothetical protein